MDIKIENLTITYDNKLVFKDFNLNIKENKITCILGESGVGKTTLLKAIANTIKYDGLIEKDNDLSFIFQEDRLIPHISVYKNLELVLLNSKKDKKEREKMIDNILDIVELKPNKNDFPTVLSGGMKRRISMARGFLYPAQILLMDEALSGLDPALKSRLINAFYKLYDTNKRTVVFVTHSIDEALLLADDVIVLNGNPANIIYRTTINIKQKERSLNNSNLDKYRKELLTTLLN